MGVVSPKVRGQPIAVITIGNTTVFWMDSTLVQMDFPIVGVDTTWDFPIYKRLRSDRESGDRVASLIAALEMDGS